jgi:hypothetical protein
MKDLDSGFYDRADAVIHLANAQLEQLTRGKVSASTLYAASRFNAWISACGFNTAEEMEAAKEETVEYFVAEYRKMLVENLDDYIANFEKYLKVNASP